MSSAVKTEIERKLHAAFAPQFLEVINESKHHAGHRRDDGDTYDGAGETHFRVRIRATVFEGMKPIDVHRAINEVLRDELDRGVHALALEASS